VDYFPALHGFGNLPPRWPERREKFNVGRCPLNIERLRPMRRAIYPGSFDPVTNGHLDVIERARKLFDEVIVAVAHNEQKQPMFTLEERLALLRVTLGDLDRVQIAPLPGLLVDFAVKQEASAVVRGLRAVSDFESEMQMAHTNRKLRPTVDTVFFMTALEHAYLSSSLIREIASFGGDVSGMVPPAVARRLGLPSA